MTEATSEGEQILTQPGAVEGDVPISARDTDPLNAAIAAAAGQATKPVGPTAEQLLEEAEHRIARDKERAAAMEAYIEAGVDKAMGDSDGSEIVTVGHLRAALRRLFAHLHLDHPENYLPK